MKKFVKNFAEKHNSMLHAIEDQMKEELTIQLETIKNAKSKKIKDKNKDLKKKLDFHDKNGTIFKLANIL